MDVVLASTNSGKLLELQVLLADLPITVRPQSYYALSEAQETGLSFVENAIIKARHASSETGLPALADDSGLSVAALNGAPGIYSARYAGVGASDRENLQKLLTDMRGYELEDRQCRFICVMTYLRHASDPLPLIAIGQWHGSLLPSARGDSGFGYDPVFFDPRLDRSAAELDAATKNAVSHRGKAAARLLAALRREAQQV